MKGLTMTDDDKRRLAAAAKQISDGNMMAEAGERAALKILSEMVETVTVEGPDGTKRTMMVGPLAVQTNRLEACYKDHTALHSRLNEIGYDILDMPFPMPLSR